MICVGDLFPHICGTNINMKHKSHPKESRNSLFWSQIQVTMAWEHKWLLFFGLVKTKILLLHSNMFLSAS